MKSRGFTLIELLVVIAIIGMLSSVVLASLNSARVKARNARRVSDVRQLVNAFNLGLDSNGSLPVTSGAWACISATCGQQWSVFGANATVDNFFTPYMNKPSDPVDGTRGYDGYLYNDSYSTLGHVIYFLLEPGASNCGPAGSIYSQTSTYVNCFMRLD